MWLPPCQFTLSSSSVGDRGSEDSGKIQICCLILTNFALKETSLQNMRLKFQSCNETEDELQNLNSKQGQNKSLQPGVRQISNTRFFGLPRNDKSILNSIHMRKKKFRENSIQIYEEQGTRKYSMVTYFTGKKKSGKKTFKNIYQLSSLCSVNPDLESNHLETKCPHFLAVQILQATIRHNQPGRPPRTKLLYFKFFIFKVKAFVTIYTLRKKKKKKSRDDTVSRASQ